MGRRGRGALFTSPTVPEFTSGSVQSKMVSTRWERPHWLHPSLKRFLRVAFETILVPVRSTLTLSCLFTVDS